MPEPTPATISTLGLMVVSAPLNCKLLEVGKHLLTTFQAQGFTKHRAKSFIYIFSLNSDHHPMTVYNYLQFLDGEMKLKELKSLAQERTDEKW